MKRIATLAAAVIALALTASAGKPKEKPAAPPTVVDQGSFGVFLNGSRVATETFTIKQGSAGNVTTSEIKLQDGKPSQQAELRLAANGNLQRYEWKELQPEKAGAVVEPQNEFVIERITQPDGKVSEQPFLMPSSTAILDDYFFSHRQLLLWRYMGANCRPEAGSNTCTMPKAQFGSVVPRQRISTMVTLEYVGSKKIAVNGTERLLSCFKLTTEGPEWLLYIDDQYRLQKISIPDSNTEVVRD